MYVKSVRISYDPAKRQRVQLTRGLDFERAIEVFAGVTLETEDTRRNYGERRILCVGYLDGRMVMVAYTVRGSTRRIISMRKCNAREIRRYTPYLDRAR